MHQDSVRYFFFDPDSKEKWDELSALVIDVYNNGLSITNALLDVLKNHVQKGKREIFGKLYSVLLSIEIK